MLLDNKNPCNGRNRMLLNQKVAYKGKTYWAKMAKMMDPFEITFIKAQADVLAYAKQEKSRICFIRSIPDLGQVLSYFILTWRARRKDIEANGPR